MIGEVSLNDGLRLSLDTIELYSRSLLLQAEMLGFIFKLLRKDTEYDWMYVRACHIGVKESLHLLEIYWLLKVRYFLVIPVPSYGTFWVGCECTHTVEMVFGFVKYVLPALLSACNKTGLVVCKSLLSEIFAQELLAEIGLDAGL